MPEATPAKDYRAEMSKPIAEGGVDALYERLTDVFGPYGWDWRILDREAVTTSSGRQWMVRGSLVCAFAMQTPEGLKMCRVTRQGFGTGSNPTTADTQALARCMRSFGCRAPQAESAPAPTTAAAPHATAANEKAQTVDGQAIYCAQCGEPLTDTTFRDKTTWTAAQLAGYGRRKHGKALCMTHYREANEALKAAAARD